MPTLTAPCRCWRNDVCGYLCAPCAAKLQTEHDQPRCTCTRYSICSSCERACTEEQLRQWMARWDANGSGPKSSAPSEAREPP